MTQLHLPIEAPAGVISLAAARTAKQAGMGLAEAATGALWAAQCQAAIRQLAIRGLPFQAADLIGLVSEPADHHQWGPQLAAAARAGVIRPYGYGPSRRTTTKASACRTWIGTTHGQEAAA